MTSLETTVDGRTLRLTSLDKVLWPATGFTKRQLIDYYAAIADALLPHITGRPVTLGRWPSGVDAPGFAQTECRGAPEWVATRAVRLRTGELRNYCVIDDLPSLLWAANLGTIELHTYIGGGATGDDATVALLDLDPGPGAGLLAAAELALDLRRLLDGWQLDACVKASGSRGLHVVVPLNVPHSFERVRAFCAAAAAEVDARAVAVDWEQNQPRRLLIAPYSPRAADHPLVSAPLAWAELERAAKRRRPDEITFTADQMRARVERTGDLFAPVLELEQRLPP